MNKKSKMVLQQLKHFKEQYKVVKLINRTVPEIGHMLKRSEVDKLMRDLPDLSVEIVPQK
jgi:hypothetical protein